MILVFCEGSEVVGRAKAQNALSGREARQPNLCAAIHLVIRERP